jgi:diguanylate cyclase (GGDEF)-like protein
MMSELPSSIALDELAPGLLALMQASGSMLSIKDSSSGRYLWANAAMLGFLGQDLQGLVARTDLELMPQADAAALRAADQRALAAGSPSADTHHFERGGHKVELLSWRCVLGSGGPAPRILTLWRHHAQSGVEQRLQQALAQIERQQAALDKLRQQQSQVQDRPNELFRREHFEAQLRREVALAQREGREFALVLLAVDRLEPLLQQRGAAAAARVADALGQLMRGNTRAMDVLSQLGPDRFAILFSGIGLATAHARVEQLRRACASEVLVQDGESFGFEISAGVASFPHSADALAALSQAAIRALNDARQRGGNQVALASIQLRGLTQR